VKVDLAPGGVDPRRASSLAQAAEALGFDGLWLAETDHDPFAALPLALTATGRLEVGTAVTIAFARSPTVLAQSAFDLAALSGGRFQLGLGTQVRAHVERRFGMAWSEPAPRLAEWIGAIRTAWAAWQDGVPFRYRSDHLDLSLMSPFFSPPPLDFPVPEGRERIPISIAGVGRGLARLAGRTADGFQVHPFHTARYLAEVLEPALQEGEARREPERAARRVERLVPVFLAPSDDAALREEVRGRISFYAATPSYRAVLALHDRERTGERLSRLAAAGRWSEMPALVDDELLGLVAVLAPWDALADALVARVAGHADRVMPLAPFLASRPERLTDPQRRWWDGVLAALRSA
jgi:probable F420-dependent oxidoreductase